jgi:hypothetical protein
MKQLIFQGMFKKIKDSSADKVITLALTVQYQALFRQRK